VAIEFVALLIVWFLLTRERKKLEGILGRIRERIDRLGQEIKAVQESVEEGHDDAQGNWERVRTLWRSGRERTELLIDTIRNRNVRRKYSNFARYSYQGIIQSLLTDGFVTAPTAANLLNMNARFLVLRRRPNAVTRDEVLAFEGWYRNVDAELPPMPEAPPSEDA
jgi:hypothetical protein